MRKEDIQKAAIAVAVFIVILVGTWFAPKFYGAKKELVTDFQSCAKAGYPVMESHPRQCRDKSGKTFTEDIGNELDKSNLIRVIEPRPGATISSPLTIKGVARGNWFFEASFPVKLIDSQGEVLASGIAEAQGEWMTEDFVPFLAVLQFTLTSDLFSRNATLVLQKDNPSGLPEYDDELVVPVILGSSETTVAVECAISGCNGELCVEKGKEVVSICLYKPEFACYKTARCERQKNGVCGWTDTAALRLCLSGKAGSSSSPKAPAERGYKL